MKHYNVIIIGGGAIGTSLLYHLAKNDDSISTLLLEKNEKLGREATGSWGSLVRVFHKNIKTTIKAAQSVPFYFEFEKHLGQSIPFHQTGSLYFTSEENLPQYTQNLNEMEKSHIQFEVLTAKDGKKKFPDFYWREGDIAVYEPKSGNTCPYSVTQHFAHYAVNKGANVSTNKTVTHIATTEAKVTGVTTEDGQEYTCDVLVISAGVNSQKLTCLINDPINVKTEVIQLNRYCRHHQEVKLPLFIDYQKGIFGHFFPNGSFVGGYIELGKNTEICLEKTSQHLSLNKAHLAKKKVGQRLGWVKNASIEGGMQALENYTPELHGFHEFSEKYHNLLISTGWSCTGFTLAPEIGRLMSEQILGSL